MEPGQVQAGELPPIEAATPPQTYWAVAQAPAEPPPAGTQYARVRRRFGAWLIDMVVLALVAAVLLWPIAADLFRTIVDALPDRARPGRTYTPEVQAAISEAFAAATPAFLRASAILQLLALAYLAGSWAAFGRSPGMALVGIRIAREEDGQPPGPGRVVIRYAGYLLSAFPFLFGFIWAIFDKRNQAWHDKLAGTIVVRGAPSAPAASGESDPRRPSIGAVLDESWALLTRSPSALLSAIGLVLVPAMVILIPVFAVFLVLQQDQAIRSLGSMRELFALAGDPAAAERYNLRMLGSAAPTIWLPALSGFLGSMVGAVLLGAAGAAVDDAGMIQQPDTVTASVRRHLGPLLALGLAGGALSAGSVLAFGLPALTVASSPSRDPGSLASLTAIAALVLLVFVPVSLYFGSIWLLAIVCVTRERLGAADAFRRAWRLSRRRMRWLAGVGTMVSLAVTVVVAPIALLPNGLLSDLYLQGQRLPIALSIVIMSLVAFVTAPLASLAFVQTYRAARDDLARQATAVTT